MLPAAKGSSPHKAFELVSKLSTSSDTILIFSDFDRDNIADLPKPQFAYLGLVGLGSKRPSQPLNAQGKPVPQAPPSARNDTVGKLVAKKLGGEYFVNQLPQLTFDGKSSSNLNLKTLLALIAIAL